MCLKSLVDWCFFKSIPIALLLVIGSLVTGTAWAQSGQISGIDDTVNTQWQAQTANNAGFGVANITESSQPYKYTTDGQSIRFDLYCAISSCSYGYTHTFNPSYGTNAATDGANSISNELMALLDSVGINGSQALEFGLDQSLCTANCGTGSNQYTRFRYAMQCDFKDTGLWRVWDANSGWVATSRNCVAFTSLVPVHFIFHYARPDLGHVQYTDFVINGVTYPLNMTQAAQSLGASATHEFIPWVNLDGDYQTDPYSMWVDQWSISYNGSGGGGGLIPTPPSNAVVFSNMDDDPISSDPSNQPVGQWGYCFASDCGAPPQQLSFTHTSNPSVDGNGLDAFDSGNAYWGVLYNHKNGQQNFATHYEVEWQFQLDVPFTSTQAVEFDFPVSIGQQFFYFGSECDNGGNWRIWNPNPGSGVHGWHATSVACPNFAANQWHTIRWYGTRTSTDFTYVALEVDGQQFSINTTISASPCCNGWADEFFVQFQPDGNAAGTGYVDAVNAWAGRTSFQSCSMPTAGPRLRGPAQNPEANDGTQSPDFQGYTAPQTTLANRAP